MPNLNRVTLMGHLGRDAEASATPNGTEVCKFSIATTNKWKDKERTDWHNVVWWRPYGPTVSLLKKGAGVSVEGSLQTRTYEKNGEKRYATEVVAHQVLVFARTPDEHSVPPPARQAQQQAIDEDDIPF